MRPSITSKRPARSSKTAGLNVSANLSRTSRIEGLYYDAEWTRGKILYKPEDQLQLTEAELEEEIVTVLTTQDNRAQEALVEWSHKEKDFILLPKTPNLITLLDIPATLELKPDDGRSNVDDETDDGSKEEEETEVELKEEEEESEEQAKTVDETEGDEEEADKEKPKKLPNQFNYCERATLTYPYLARDDSTQTVPPPTDKFDSTIYQWTIFDAYQEDFERQRKEKEKDRKAPPVAKKDETKKKSTPESKVNERMQQSAKILERMVTQNIFNDISQDYRYWDDPSDEFKDGEGSLLPLWKFNYEKTRKHNVTHLCFNSRYYDLFAVSFGTMSVDNTLPTTGHVCLFSLKNPSYPEWICPTESPVMCVDINKLHPHLIVIGALDGTVAIYNMMIPNNTPQYKSNDVSLKHGGLVWQVCWAPDTEEGNLAFYSVSIDGKIKYWILNQIDMGVTTVMTLYLDQPPVTGPDGTEIRLKACGTCFAFHPEDPHIFLVGTEEGTIYKCNTAYSSIYMQIYKEAHDMPVYRIVYNNYNSSIFASCSCDWRIKIWEDGRSEPLFMFDLGVPIGDVQWAPYSSTVLACVSNDGKVTVFDLNVNKYRPICSQPVVSKKRGNLTRLRFNDKMPFIIVGDDKGTVRTYKLSPNLRVKVKPTKKQQHLSHKELESLKLEKLLSFVREPAVLNPPKDERVVDK